MKKVLIVIHLVLLISTTIFANDSTKTIRGIVIDKLTGEIISSANIKITGNRLNTTIESDFAGKFIITDINFGIYKFFVSRLGYVDFDTNIAINSNIIPYLNLYLTPVELQIEKINVTATKTEQTLQQTPSSISIVSEDDIKSRNIVTFDQTLENIQGITINRSSSINVNSLSIRGSSDVAGGGIGNRVLLLLDGRPSLSGDSKGALWSLIPVSIIEKTEVVKGAFSSLYGSSAIGGVINVITKQPTFKPFTVINSNYGFYEKLSDSLRFTNQLLTFKGVDILHSNTINKLSYLLDVNIKQSDGYAQQTDYQFYSGYGKFGYDLFSNRDLELTIQYTNSQSAFPHYWRKDPGQYSQPYQVSQDLLGDRINKESESIDLFYKAIPNSKVKYTSRFYYYRLYSVSEYNPDNQIVLLYGQPGNEFDTYITSYNFGNITQLDYNINKTNYLITGTDVQWNIVRSTPESILYGNQQQYNLAYYVQDQINMLSNNIGYQILTSTLAARVDYNKFIGGSGEFQLSPKYSILFSPDIKSGILENSSFRFLIGRAFRTPSIAELFLKKELFGGFDFVYNPNLKPEQISSVELGFRKQYENRFILDISFYFNYYDNLIQYVNIGTGIYGPFQVQNISKSQIKGFDFILDYSSKFRILNENFEYKFGFGYSYIDARDLSPGRTDDFLPYKPKNLFNFNVNMKYYGFNFNVNGRFVGKIDKVLFYKYEEPASYFSLDLKLSKKVIEKINIFFAVNNVTNVFYQELERIAAPNRYFNTGISIEL